MAEAVVDVLEVVDVQEQDGHGQLAAALGDEGVLDAVAEQRAVRQAGERVVERLVLEFGLERLALADIADVEHDPLDRLLAEQVRREHLHLAPALARVPTPELGGDGLPRGCRGGCCEHRVDARCVVAVDEFRHRPPDHLLGCVAERRLDRRARELERPVGIHDADHVRGVADQGTEPRLGALVVALLGERDGLERERDLAGEHLKAFLGGAAEQPGRPHSQRARERLLGEQRRERQHVAALLDADYAPARERAAHAGGQVGETERRDRRAVRVRGPDGAQLAGGGVCLVDAGADALLLDDGAGGMERRCVDLLEGAGPDQRLSGEAQRGLAAGRLLVAADDPGHPQQHEAEHQRGRGDQREQVELLVECFPHDDDQRRGQARARQQREAGAGEPHVRGRPGLGELAHRGVQRGCPDERVVDGPAGVGHTAGLEAASEQLGPVDHVAQQQHDDPGEQEQEGRLAAVAAGGYPRHDPEHEDVHDRIRHRRRAAQQRQARVVDIGGHQIDPDQRRERERDDHRVHVRRAVSVLVAVVDEQHHPRDQERVEGEVEGVRDRRERQRAADEPFVVVRDHVAGHEQGLPGGEQIPRQPACPGRVLPCADDQRCDGRAADQVEDQAAAEPARAAREMREQVAAREHGHRGEVDGPCVLRADAAEQPPVAGWSGATGLRPVRIEHPRAAHRSRRPCGAASGSAPEARASEMFDTMGTASEVAVGAHARELGADEPRVEQGRAARDPPARGIAVLAHTPDPQRP